MPSKEICEFCDRVRNVINSKRLIGLPNRGAIEVHIKEFEPEALYIAVQNGNISVEPYDYKDKDATVTLDLKTFYDIYHREVSVEEALQTQRVIVDGDGEYLYCLQRNI
jgi:putative sterol carrier protein